MGKLWSRDHLIRRIDRCYLIAAATKIPEIRRTYVDKARHYRRLLAGVQVAAL